MGAQERKHVLFVADSLDNAYRFQKALSTLDVDTTAGSSMQFTRMLAAHPNCDLVVYEVRPGAASELHAVEQILLDHGGTALLAIVQVPDLGQLRMPTRLHCDFVVSGASEDECFARAHALLQPGQESSSADYVTVDAMTINLATYQVQVSGDPIDLTYLEYALLSFLATHPGRTYSRDALLRRVWGFDYYGGSRTVDVHVRRIRAKLGPELAQHLETVRGVGYLWS